MLAALDSPLGQVLYAAATGDLEDVGELAWKPGSAVAVVLLIILVVPIVIFQNQQKKA